MQRQYNHKATHLGLGTAAIVAALAGIALGPSPSPISAQNIPTGSRAIPKPGFVQRSGNQFTLNGARFQFIGATAELLQGPEGRARIEQTIESASKSLSVIRVWAFSDGPLRAPTEWEKGFYFRMGPAPQHQLEDSYVALDRVMAQAREKGLRVILVLSNHWADYGGIQRYYEWFNESPRQTSQAPERNVPNPKEAIFFYTDPRAQEAYQLAAKSILTRRNSITGELYRDDPTIFSIELMNEPGVEPAYAQAQMKWFAQMASFVRSLAPYHLIGSGVSGGAFPYPPAVKQWKETAQLENIDYFDLHIYPGETSSWSLNAASELDRTLDESVRFAHEMAGKPIILGEIGFTSESADRFQQSNPKDARKSRQKLLQDVLRQALNKHDLDGALFWLFVSTPNHDKQSHRIHPEVPEDQEFLQGIRLLRDELKH